jgi:hypothetical protein
VLGAVGVVVSIGAIIGGGAIVLGGDLVGGGIHPGPPPESVRVPYRVVIDGHMSKFDNFPVFAGERVSIVITLDIPTGAVLDCLLVAVDGYDGGGGCGYDGKGSPIFVTHRHVGAGQHSYAMTWRALLGPPMYPRELIMNWVVTPPPGSRYSGGLSGTNLPGFSVLPDPSRAPAALAGSPSGTLVPECGLLPAQLLPTVIMLDCQTGDTWVTDLVWSQWNKSRAVAIGLIYTTDWCVTAGQARNCQNQQSFLQHQVTLVLQRVRTAGGQRRFTFASVSYHIALALHTTFRTFALS